MARIVSLPLSSFSPLFSCFCSLIESFCHHVNYYLVLLTSPWLIAAAYKCIWTTAWLVHFWFEILLRRGQLGSVQSAGAFIPVYSQEKNANPFPCHPSLIWPLLCAIVCELLFQIASVFFPFKLISEWSKWFVSCFIVCTHWTVK